MISLEHLPSGAMTQSDWGLLKDALSHDYAGYTLQHLSHDLDQFQSQLWLLRGTDTRLLLVTQICSLPAGRELHLQYVAGTGWFRYFEEVLTAIEGLARALNCRFISGRFRGRHGAKFYSRFGGKSAGVWLFKDLSYGQQEDHNDSVNDTLWPEPAGSRLQPETRH